MADDWTTCATTCATTTEPLLIEDVRRAIVRGQRAWARDLAARFRNDGSWRRLGDVTVAGVTVRCSDHAVPGSVFAFDLHHNLKLVGGTNG